MGACSRLTLTYTCQERYRLLQIKVRDKMPAEMSSTAPSHIMCPGLLTVSTGFMQGLYCDMQNLAKVRFGRLGMALGAWDAEWLSREPDHNKQVLFMQLSHQVSQSLCSACVP